MDSDKHSNSYIDLHIHTNYSDGVFSPKEVVEYASKIKLFAIGITDHDSVDGIDEAIEAALGTGVEIVPGIELSAEVTLDSQKSEVHILGYFLDYKSKKLQKALDILKKARQNRAIEILETLKKNKIELKNIDFLYSVENKALGRLHFARALVKEKFVGSIQEAFRKYLSNGCPAYVPKYSISVREAIELILSIGGAPIMAHPYYAHYSDKNVFKTFVQDGLAGIEAWHIKHSECSVKKFLDLAKEFNLVVTGGSDCHGPFNEEYPVMGKIKVPYSVLEKLKDVKKR
ncbi:MAG: PHP domain-containing protein [Endomicrobium sp.]|jgi:predicted metal-dependent phosphoesterase TrpH|nr:PHP domain-containing protein [Endomicrobium sp.]